MKIKVPSKTFLWGEYAALVGGVGGILTHSPFFELNVFEDTYFEKHGSSANVVFAGALFHADSPAGRTLKIDADQTRGYEFKDPYNLGGGFGRSTAEWICAKALNLKSESHVAQGGLRSTVFKAHAVIFWKEYRKLFSGFKKSPSGYDVLAQMDNTILVESSETLDELIESQSGRVSVIDGRMESPKIISSGPLELNLGILVFKTKMKVMTHEHLEALGTESLDYLKTLSFNVANAYIAKDVRAFIVNQKAFDAELRRLRFITAESTRFCDQIAEMDGVLHARGCGALGADVIAVFYKLDSIKDLISKITDSLELIFIADVKGID